MNLTWATPPGATCLHAALALADGIELIDGRLADQLSNLPARVALVQGVGAIASGAPVDEPLATLLQAFPDPGEELSYRARPLREQWDARGPGLLRALARLTTDSIVLAEATVALAQPVVGGHGVAIAGHRLVLLEAMLANPHPTLPEIVRLAWLLAQLGGGDGRLSRIALVPAVLAAAEEVELVTLEESLLTEALTAWRIVTDCASVQLLTSRLWCWWNDCGASPGSWEVARAKLDLPGTFV